MSSEYSKQVYFKDEIEAGKLDQAVDAVLQDEVEEVVEGPRDKQVLIRVSEMQRDKWQEAVEHSSGVEIFVAFPNHFPVSDWLSFLRLCRHKKFGLHKMRGVKLLCSTRGTFLSVS